MTHYPTGRPTGRPPIPNERKQRLGAGAAPSPESVVSLPTVNEVPEPPDGLGDAGRAAWESVWSSAAGWLASSDVLAVTLLALMVDERAQLRNHLMSGAGDFHDRAGLRALDTQINASLAALGLTPTDRARLGLAAVTTTDALEDFRRRARERRGES